MKMDLVTWGVWVVEFVWPTNHVGAIRATFCLIGMRQEEIWVLQPLPSATIQKLPVQGELMKARRRRNFFFDSCIVVYEF